ncbi:hypothetical protein V5799_029686 [Amblyomma americanum]|uniref:Uncharacterized protein n=1 Tax=Amblyomma americanum TaxID=6943 RepID=A0AAQ4EQG5_AMBAM
MEEDSCYDLSLLRVLRSSHTPQLVTSGLSEVIDKEPAPLSPAADVDTNQLQASSTCNDGAGPVTTGTASTLPVAPPAFESTQGPLIRVDNAAPAQRAASDPLQYFLIGILFAGLFVAAALVVIGAPSGPLSSYDLRSEQKRLPAQPPLMPRYDIQDVADENLFVVIPRNDQPPQHVVQDAPADGALARPGDFSVTGAAASEEAPQYAGAVDSMPSERRVKWYAFSSNFLPEPSDKNKLVSSP